MSTLRDGLAEYLKLRRGLGYQLDRSGRLVGQFCDWLTARGQPDHFTIEDAVTWARLPAGAAHHWWGMRLGAVRTFAAYLHATGADVAIIPAGLLPATSTRAAPYLYSQHDLDALLGACTATFANERIAATMGTIVALLAATGMRIGEALRLQIPDLDVTGNVLLVRAGKSLRDRYLPLDPTTTTALTVFLALPARAATRPEPDGPIFVTCRGTAYGRETIELYFQQLTRAAGLQPHGRSRPRLHDLRHTFATAHMAAAYRDGGDPQRTLTLLTTWLGHTSTAHTYWYLTASPQLMAAAAQRLGPGIPESDTP